MNPNDKYITPGAVPPVPECRGLPRIGSSPLALCQQPSARSISPTATWKRLLGLKPGLGRDDRGRQLDIDGQSLPSIFDDSRSVASSEGSRTRDISPESLRRFLSDDMPVSPPTSTDDMPFVMIPEDIVEENEDDENFATSAISENMSFATCLSPPPFKRTHSDSSSSLHLVGTNDSSMTLTKFIHEEPPNNELDAGLAPAVPTLPQIDFELPSSRFSISTIGSGEDAVSPQSPNDETPSFYDSNDDDDVLSSNDGDTLPFQPMSLPSTRKQSMDQTDSPFAGYSLPQPFTEGKHLDISTTYAAIGSPALIAETDAGVPLGDTALLAAPVDSGLDLVSELSWMVDAIGEGN
jgi:hypothetical protein